MLTFILLLSISQIIFSFYIFHKIEKERSKNRILQAFMAGTIRSVSDYMSSTDRANVRYDGASSMPKQKNKAAFYYEDVLENIEYELLKNVPMTSPELYNKWLTEQRQIFIEEKYCNDGFIFMNFDLFDKIIKKYNSKD